MAVTIFVFFMAMLIFATGRTFSMLIFILLRRTMLFFIARGVRSGMSVLVLFRRMLLAVLVLRNTPIFIFVARARIQGTAVSMSIFILALRVLVFILARAVLVFRTAVMSGRNTLSLDKCRHRTSLN